MSRDDDQCARKTEDESKQDKRDGGCCGVFNGCLDAKCGCEMLALVYSKIPDCGSIILTDVDREADSSR